MSTLRTLLGSDHPLLIHNIAALEKAAGCPGIDVQIIAEAARRSRSIITQLGLDPDEHHPHELYHALNALAHSKRSSAVLSPSDFTMVNWDGHVISLNLLDVVENAHHELSFDQRTRSHATRFLRMEIVKRYAEHERTNNDMVERLAKEVELSRDNDQYYPSCDLKKAPRMLAVGDIFSDVFIQLNDEESRVIEEDGAEWLALPFGSKPPYDEAVTVDAVGPSPNAGISCARLGLDVSLMAWMGEDKVAHETRKYLESEDVDHSLIVGDSQQTSNVYYVLRRGAERTILVKNEDYTYEWVEPDTKPDWVYLSLISDQSWQLHEDMLAYLEAYPDVQFAFQPGTFHFKWGAKKLEKLYKRATIVVVNREEAAEITGESVDDITKLLDAMRELGPTIAVVTDGPNGSYASFDDRHVSVPNYPDIAPPLDRTGAGDAFASTIVAALAQGESMETALLWAPINSMNVVQKLGAQAGLQTRQQIEAWLKKAPKNYRVRDI